MGGEIMGRLEETEHIDLTGLQVFKITKMKKERIGDEVRLICGHEILGQTIWTHIAIFSAADLASEANQCVQIAMRPKQLVSAAH